MYIHIGQETVIKKSEIVGIFDLDNTTVMAKTRDFLSKAEKNGQVITVSYELPKSFIICEKNGKKTVYITPISTSTLLKRNETII